MKKQKRISIMVTIFLIMQCLSSVFFVSNSFATASINVQMYNANTQTSSNTIYPFFKIYNASSTSINLSTIKVRYYYTSDGLTGQTYTCDYAGGTSNITSSTIGNIVSMTNQTSTANNYLEIYFTSTAGSLSPGAYIEVKGRITNTGYINYTQSNDYSFNPTATNYAASSTVTAYVNEVLQSGTEPVNSPTSTPSSTPTAPQATDKYEAENGITTNSSMIKSNAYCSNGKYVGDLGLSNTLTINANIPETATYTMSIYYRTATNKAVKFAQSSSATSYGFICPGNVNPNSIGCVSKEVYLVEGACDLVFSNVSASAPDIDFIKITKDLVSNTDFESGISPSPKGWSASSSKCSWDANGGINTSKALSITSTSHNEIYECDYFESDEIQLEPYKYYKAEVSVRTSLASTINCDSFQGGNISVLYKATNQREYIWYWGMISKGINNTGWETAVINFQAPYDGKVKFRLNNCGAIGTCWFDNFKVYPDDNMVKMEGEKVVFGVQRSDIIDSGISSAGLDQFISNYDTLINENIELTGLNFATHFENEKIKILSRINLPWAGESSTKAFVWWIDSDVKEEFIRLKTNSAFGWVLPHEIGHQFDRGEWNFDGEFWASFKAYATLTSMQSPVYMGTTCYGAPGAPAFSTFFENKGLTEFNNYEYVGDYIIGQLGVKSNIPWSAYTNAFQYFISNSNTLPYNGYERFCLFLNKLDEYGNTGVNTRNTLFTDQQLKVIEYQLSKNSSNVTSYEAETTTNPNLTINSSDKCSGLQYVSGIGLTNNLEFNVRAYTSGAHLIKITYLTGVNKPLYLTVNNTLYIIPCTAAADAYTPKSIIVEVNLNADPNNNYNNTIQLGNPNGSAPNIDLIEVVKRYVE